VNDQTKREDAVILGNTNSDQSSYPKRFNEFSLIEKTSPNNVAGEVLLEETGLYHYYVYEQASTVNLNYLLSDREVESGKAHVPSTYHATDSVYTPNTNFSAYNP